MNISEIIQDSRKLVSDSESKIAKNSLKNKVSFRGEKTADTLALPAVGVKYSRLPTGIATPMSDNEEEKDYDDRRHREEDSIQTRSVRFYSSQPYITATSRKICVLEKEEKVWPLDKADKTLQDHFVSM